MYKSFWTDMASLLFAEFIIGLLMWNGSYTFVSGNQVLGVISIECGLVLAALLVSGSTRPHGGPTYRNVEVCFWFVFEFVWDLDNKFETKTMKPRLGGTIAFGIIALSSYLMSGQYPIVSINILKFLLVFIAVLSCLFFVWFLIGHIRGKLLTETKPVK